MLQADNKNQRRRSAVPAPSASDADGNKKRMSTKSYGAVRGLSMRNFSIYRTPTPKVNDFEDIIMTLDMPHGQTSVIPFSDVYDTHNHRVLPNSTKSFKDCIEDLIRNTIDIPQKMHETLLMNLRNSYYFMIFYVGGKKYVYNNDKNAVRYFAYCKSHDITPHVFVRFMHQFVEGKDQPSDDVKVAHD